jgi:beta-lactamase superfamily II metal-dependent hydrolase
MKYDSGMRIVPLRIALLTLVLARSAVAADPLRLYFIDTEGGQATLVVTPSKQTLLIDTGYDGFGGRDTVRIRAAMKDADVKKLDYLLITHFHSDHVGGVANLMTTVPVANFLDHGVSIETNAYDAAWAGAFAKGKHQVVGPGDKIPLKDVGVTIVAGAGKDRAGTGEANAHCSGLAERPAETGENAQSLALVIEFGKFRFLDPGDLTYNRELALLCPRNQVGKVDLFLSTHHGSESPKAIWDLGARVAIMNNGPRKGGDAAGWKTIAASPGMDDVWQLHFGIAAGADGNSRDPLIANLVLGGDEDGKFLKVEALPTGEFTVTNSRNKYSKGYKVR